jgi:two-component system cell cycle sensor histidine kinase/response regulator CckA
MGSDQKRASVNAVPGTVEHGSGGARDALLASIVESCDDAIIGQAVDGTITSWNTGAEQIFGYPRDEILGRHISVLATPEQSDDGRGLWEPTQPKRHVEQVCVTKDGRRIHISLTTSPIKDEHGLVAGAATIARDISERKAADAVRAELEQQLQQAQKMEAIGQLADGIAHDFNNLLAVILNYAGFVSEDMSESDPRWEDLQRIRDASRSAVALIRQLLVFSRKEASEPEIVDANEIVVGMEKLLHRAIGEHIEFETRLAADLRLTKMDRGQAEQVLMNLTVNARDAMPGGGALRIETSNVTLDEYVAVRQGLQPGDYVRMTVTDTGCGMAPDVAARIFEPFFTTKEGEKGTGLGLATVYAIAQQAEGTVSVHSEPGVGTTFDVYLPAADDEVAQSTIRIEQAIPGGRGETILLVEDQDAVRDLAHRILSANGYRVLTARSGQEALDVARTHTDSIDVLLTDVVMPGMSGDELAGWLSNTHEGLKTIFMSGFSEQALAPHRLAVGAGDFLAKPFTADNLLLRVHETLASRIATEPGR